MGIGDTDDRPSNLGLPLEASPLHRISIDPLTCSFGEYSPVAKELSTPPQNTDSMLAAIENSSLPDTAKRVLLRLEKPIDTPLVAERIEPTDSSLPEESLMENKRVDDVDAELEQTRSMTLIQKLRQSAFRRKMNPTIDVFTTLPTVEHFADHPMPHPTECTSPKLPDSVERNELRIPQTLVVGRVDGPSLQILSPPMMEEKKENLSLSPRLSRNNAPNLESDMLSDSALPCEEEEELENKEEIIQACSLYSDFIPPPNSSRLGHITHSTLELGASSMAFIQHVRSAAFRRKKTLTRSRDSLMAKERLHRETIAASKVARLQMEELERTTDVALQQRDKSTIPQWSSQTFKARPLPKTTGWKGSGGLSGVPKVAKRPPTIPKSPCLGSQRFLATEHDYGSHPPRKDRVSSSSSNEFKALPLPNSSLREGGAGQAGIPKVPKRKITIPYSPSLGLRRRSQPKVSWNVELSTDDAPPPDDIPLSDGGSSLLGTDISKENDDPAQIVVSKSTNSTAYIPHSTRRAEQRAAFEIRRAHNEQLRHEAQRRERLKQVHSLQKELNVLRIEI